MSGSHRMPVGVRIEGHCRNLSVTDNVFDGFEPMAIGPTGVVEGLEYRRNRSIVRKTVPKGLSAKDVRELKKLLEDHGAFLEAQGKNGFEEAIKRSPIEGWLNSKSIELGANIVTMLSFAKDLFFGR